MSDLATTLTTTHRTTVTEDQIDHLGHMNVRFYGVAARNASAVVAGELGVGDRPVQAVDVYTRHFREQLLGASLEVRSGVLGGGEGTLRVYHELANTDTGDIAASFVHRLVVDDPSWPAPGSLDGVVEVPAHGASRTLRLDSDPLAGAPDLETARSLGLAVREVRAVGADECDAAGRFRAGEEPMLVWGGVPTNGSAGPALHDGPNGQKLGWAAMENRVTLRRLPEVGDRIQSFGAAIAVNDKTTHRMMWAFDVDRGDLLIGFEVVDLCFDTVSRSAVSIPDDLRASAEAVLHPEFGPTTR